MNPGRFKSLLVLGIVVLGIVATIMMFRPGSASGRRSQRLVDGSTMELREIAVATNTFLYQHQSGNRLQRLLAPLAPIVPDFIATRILPINRGSMSFSGSFTNLIVVTVNQAPVPPSGGGGGADLSRLKVFDEEGNEYDACWGASTLGMSSEWARAWNLGAFPRRSPTLGLRFLGTDSSNHWVTVAEFTIRNPLHATFPQWTAEPWPTTRNDGDLEVTLKEFEAGAPFRSSDLGTDERLMPRKTRLRFEFAQNGRPLDNWRVQKLSLADATGNAWSPYLDFVKQDFDWATNGTVEFHGALWPGEAAWKLDAEFVRTDGFLPDELCESPLLTIPTTGVDTNLNVRFQCGDLTIALAGLASPQADQPDPFKWIAKYWGDQNKDKVISLAVEITPNLSSNRLSFVRAVDQNSHDAALVSHNGQDEAEQAVLLVPAEGAEKLKFVFALQRSRFAHFLARPKFVGGSNIKAATPHNPGQ